MLSQEALAEWLRLTSSVQSDPQFADLLVDQFDPETRVTIPGIMSVADIADSFLGGTLETASHADTSAALSAAFAEGSPVAAFRYSLSEQAELRSDQNVSRCDANSSSNFYTSICEQHIVMHAANQLSGGPVALRRQTKEETSIPPRPSGIEVCS